MSTAPLDPAPAALGLRVLLVDPSAADRAAVVSALDDELPGVTVTACASVPAARERLDRGAYDVVVVDLSLGDDEAPCVVGTVRAAAPGAAVLVLTADDDSPLARQALARGADDVVVKHQAGDGQLATAVRHAVQRVRRRPAAPGSPLLATTVLDALEAPTCAVDADARIVAVNQAWVTTALGTGGDLAACGVGADYLAACAVPADGTADAIVGGEVAAGLRDVLAGLVPRFHAEYPFHGADRQQWFSVRITPADVGGLPGAVVTHVDVTELRQAQDALSHQALHDPLTGLPNRSLLTDRLQQALADSNRRGTGTAVAFVDLDHFKRVNDTLGHPAGDALLAQVAERLHAQVRAGDTVARFSGDEFVVVWRDLHGTDEAQLLSDRLAEALAPPFELAGTTVSVTASIGVAVGRAPSTPEELLLAADAAMYDAKGHGRGQVRVFSAALRRDAEERMATELGLEAALERGELVLHYQPVVELGTGRVVSAEALVRWQHPERGLVAPDLFIPVAEASGQIVALGRWVLEQACRDAAGWTGAAAGLDVAVNLSVRQLTQPDVLRHVHQALSLSGLAPSRLMLEVTESAVMEDAEAAGIALDALSSLGVRIAIDDFGTGYSSLLHLRRYPFSALKVDRAFVSGLGLSQDDDAICTSVISLAHAVGATSIAEGVETAEQYAVLRALGCHQAQGFLWSRAVPGDALGAAVEAVALVPVPVPLVVPSARARGRAAARAVDPAVTERMLELHRAGASPHTIAAALNREGAAHPAGVRWHAHTVARHVAPGRAHTLR